MDGCVHLGQGLDRLARVEVHLLDQLVEIYVVVRISHDTDNLLVDVTHVAAPVVDYRTPPVQIIIRLDPAHRDVFVQFVEVLPAIAAYGDVWKGDATVDDLDADLLLKGEVVVKDETDLDDEHGPGRDERQQPDAASETTSRQDDLRRSVHRCVVREIL